LSCSVSSCLLDKLDVNELQRRIFRTYWPLFSWFFGVCGLFFRRKSVQGRSDQYVPLVGVAGNRTFFERRRDMLSESTGLRRCHDQRHSSDFKGGDCVHGLRQVSRGPHRSERRSREILPEGSKLFLGMVAILVPASMAVMAKADTVLGSVTLNGQKGAGIYFPRANGVAGIRHGLVAGCVSMPRQCWERYVSRLSCDMTMPRVAIRSAGEGEGDPGRSNHSGRSDSVRSASGTVMQRRRNCGWCRVSVGRGRRQSCAADHA